MKNLTQALNKAAAQIGPIGKNATVGKNAYAYKGVNWSDVAEKIGPALHDNGLVFVPCDYEIHTNENFHVESGKGKRNVFVEVKAKYTLMHESGESLTVSGLGHGIDTADKAAGKATTYALKNALLYAFTIAAKVDDTDETHSNDIPAPLPRLSAAELEKAVKALSGGKTTIEAIEKTRQISAEQLKALKNATK